MEWTDGRLDDLANRVDAGFKEAKADSRELRQAIHGLRTEVKGDITGLRTEVKGDIDGLRVEIRIVLSLVLALIGADATGLLGG